MAKRRSAGRSQSIGFWVDLGHHSSAIIRPDLPILRPHPLQAIGKFRAAFGPTRISHGPVRNAHGVPTFVGLAANSDILREQELSPRQAASQAACDG